MMRDLFLALTLTLVACGTDPASHEVAAADPAESTLESTAASETIAQPVDVVPARERDAELESEMRALIAKFTKQASGLTQGKANRQNVHVAVHVREAGRSGQLASIGAKRAQAPASNMKLVTSAAALCLLGSDWSFRTRFVGTGPIENGVLRGDLVVLAGGDPLHDRNASGSVDSWLQPIVRKLAADGLKSIEGDLVLDEGTYAKPSPAPGWPDPSQFWQDYCALSGGFSANAGCVTATVTPGRQGAPANVRVEPRNHGLPERINVTTGNKGSQLTVVVGASTGRVIVRGKIAQGARVLEEPFSHPDPVNLFGAALRGALAEEGIELKGTVRRERLESHANERDLVILESPLVDALVAINTDSNNPVTEQVLLAMGDAVAGEGSREGGARAVRLALERLDVSTTGFVQADGSGLSRLNRVTAEQLTAMIAAAMEFDDKAAQAFRDSLAIGGRTGTLEKRLLDERTAGRVFAKTGWISGVSALSGIVLDGEERELIFSILVEYPRLGGLNRTCWKPLQDELCALLAEYRD